MAPRTFHPFPKLPIELRLRIWNLTMEPRVIRAKWDNDFDDKDCKQIYVLAAGPVPRALLASKESRDEAKRRYCLVKSRLPFHSRYSCEENSIWINLDIDTIYFVNFPATKSFLSWMRRVSNKRTGGAHKSIKHIAIHAGVLDRLKRLPNLPDKTGFIYQLVAEHPSLTDIAIMLDNSKFEDDPHPHFYTITEAKQLGSSKGGGRWGNRRVRSKMDELFGAFFTQPKATGKEFEMLKEFRENNPEWTEPTFPMMSISKNAKCMAGYSVYSLPAAAQQVIPGAKARSACPSSTKAPGSKN
jgi:hypothetical protein